MTPEGPEAMRLRRVGEELWIADGPTLSFLGFPYPTRMAVARLSGGRLWVWSPVALDPPLRAELDALGEVRFLVEPNKLHHLALAEWARAYPEAELHAPPGLAAKRRDLRFHGELGDEPPVAWQGAIAHAVFRGSLAVTEVVFLHHASKTALVGDLVQKMDPPAGWRGLLLRWNGLTGPAGSTPREWRASFLRRAPARRALERVLAGHPENLVIAHGRCALGGGERALRDSFAWLRPSAGA